MRNRSKLTLELGRLSERVAARLQNKQVPRAFEDPDDPALRAEPEEGGTNRKEVKCF